MFSVISYSTVNPLPSSIVSISLKDESAAIMLVSFAFAISSELKMKAKAVRIAIYLFIKFPLRVI